MTTHEIIARQFQSPLKMLTRAIELCPDDLWLVGDPNRFWHIAFHALFYTHFYLAPEEAAFVPWQQSRLGYNYLGEAPRKSSQLPEPAHVIDVPYTKTELLAYALLVHQEVEIQVAALDLEASSGFYWLPMNKLELQLYNIRHLQHHTGQLADRLRTQANVGLPWVR